MKNNLVLTKNNLILVENGLFSNITVLNLSFIGHLNQRTQIWNS